MSAHPQDDLDYALSYSLHKRGANLTDVAQALGFKVLRPEGETYLSLNGRVDHDALPLTRDANGVQVVHYPFGNGYGRYQDNPVGFILNQERSLRSPLDAAAWVEKQLVPTGQMDAAPGHDSPVTIAFSRHLQSKGVGLARLANTLLGYNVEADRGGVVLVHPGGHRALAVTQDETGLERAVYPAPVAGRKAVDAVRLVMDRNPGTMPTPAVAVQVIPQRLRQMSVRV